MIKNIDLNQSIKYKLDNKQPIKIVTHHWSNNYLKVLKFIIN